MSNLMSRTLMARIGTIQVPKRKENSLKKIPRIVQVIQVEQQEIQAQQRGKLQEVQQEIQVQLQVVLHQ